MNRKMISLTIIISFIFLIPCKGQGVNLNLFDAPTAEKYMPLKGEWEFHQVIKSNNVIINRFTLKYSSLPKREMNGIEVIPLKCIKYIDRQKDIILYFYSITPKAVIYYAEQKLDEVEPKVINGIMLKNPIKKGQSWDSGVVSKSIESVDETVTVPAGTFNKCLKIKTIRRKGNKIIGEGISWYAIDVGHIKSIYTIPGKKIITTLISFKK